MKAGILITIVVLFYLGAVAAAEEGLALYVRRVYRNVTGTTISGRCESCQEDPSIGCFTTWNVWIDGFCYPESLRPSQSESHMFYLLNETHACQENFDDNECRVKKDGESACGGKGRGTVYPLDQCTGRLESLVRLENWCIESSSPKGEFVSPVTFRRYWRPYEDEEVPPEACQVGNEGNAGLVGLQWVDSGLCLPSIPVVGDRRVLGGTLSKCNERTGEWTVEAFSDRSCKEKDPGLEFTGRGLPPTCHRDPDQTNPSMWEFIDCREKFYYCKDLANTDLNMERVGPPPSSGRPMPSLKFLLSLSILAIMFASY